MKASEMIKQLEGLIDKCGDLPLAMMEYDHYYERYIVVESSGVETVLDLCEDDEFYNEDDELTKCDKVFLLD